MKTLLLLGHRKGIFDAAESLGYKVVLWDEKPVAATIASRCKLVIEAPFEDENFLPASLPTSLQNIPIDAVIALKEKSTPMAALLRQWWNLRGVPLETALKCHDKQLMKEHSLACGLPITEFSLIDLNTHVEDLIARWNYPIILKPRRSSGRRGLQLVNEGTPALPFQHLAEKYVSGDECSVESLIVDGKICFTNITQYYRLMHANIVPAPFDPALAQRILALNQRVISAFQIPCGITHAEFFYDDHNIIFGEIAVRPPGGYIMNLIANAYDVPIWEQYLKAELNQPIADLQAKFATASWILHPGEGTVRAIHGFDQLGNDPNIIDKKLRLSIGDYVSARIGVGEDVGRILLKAPNFDSLQQSLLNLENHFSIECY